MDGSKDLWPFVNTGPYPTRFGNRVQPWIDGQPAFSRICEAIEAATESVWATVTFMWPSFQMPDGRGSALDVLELAARRGVDVRLIFWRPDDETANHRPNAFWGSADHFEVLKRQYTHLKIRWDRAHPGYCQHQKTWLIDASRDTGMCFVGGINLNPHSVVTPDHRGDGHNHDAYIELAGPSVGDVHHNFVQRWNEASERASNDGRWGADSERDLLFPDLLPAECGVAYAQIQRTTHPGRYQSDGAFDFAAGEKTNLDQYRTAIKAARRTIYIENQHLDVPDIVVDIEEALSRGIEVIVLLPMQPMSAWQDIASHELQARLRTYEGFTLCGIAGLGNDGRRHPVHVHAKIMLVDDEWATIGSCNLHHYSLFGNGELNVAFRDHASVRTVRIELFHEHLAMDTSDMDVITAFRLFRQVARENRSRHEHGKSCWQGLAIDLAGGSLPVVDGSEGASSVKG